MGGNIAGPGLQVNLADHGPWQRVEQTLVHSPVPTVVTRLQWPAVDVVQEVFVVSIKGIDRHPIVEDDVVIYAGATILGRIVIGKGSSIGGNVWLTHAVPPGSRITQEAPVERP